MSPLSKKENFPFPLALHGQNVPPAMIYVGKGTFRMGTRKDDPDGFGNEYPDHNVTIADFFIGNVPVTQALWKAVMEGENPSYFKADDRPVERVSWYDVTELFLPKLNELLPGYTFRLPTEAEWEYAARGGRLMRQPGFRMTKYAGSDKIGEVGWYETNSHGETKPVGLKRSNQLGLYDMSGNVWEWCEDDWHGSYDGAPENGRPWIENPQGGYRVPRGGSYFNEPRSCRVAYRNNNHPVYRFRSVGFRLAASFQSVG